MTEQTGLEVSHFVGSMGIDFWSQGSWRRQIEQSSVLVMTYQIMLNILSCGFLQVRTALRMGGTCALSLPSSQARCSVSWHSGNKACCCTVLHCAGTQALPQSRTFTQRRRCAWLHAVV